MRIVVTAIGSVSGPFVVQRLKSLGHVVFGVNVATTRVPPAAMFCDSLHIVAHSDDAVGYLWEMLDVASAVRPDWILPLTDPEAWLLSQARELFEDVGVDIACSNAESLSRVRDKMNLAVEARELKIDGFSVIPSYSLLESAARTHPLPLVAKPRIGRSSIGLRILDRAEHEIGGSAEGLVYQPFIDGHVITVDALRIGSQTSCCSRVELIRSSAGLGLAAAVFEDPKLVAIVSKLLDFFRISGLVNIEFIRQGDMYYLMDFNLRASAGLRFSYRAGSDFLAHVFRGPAPDPCAEEAGAATVARREWGH